MRHGTSIPRSMSDSYIDRHKKDYLDHRKFLQTIASLGIFMDVHYIVRFQNKSVFWYLIPFWRALLSVNLVVEEAAECTEVVPWCAVNFSSPKGEVCQCGSLSVLSVRDAGEEYDCERVVRIFTRCCTIVAHLFDHYTPDLCRLLHISPSQPSQCCHPNM